MAVSPRHMAVEITGLETALPDAQKDRRGRAQMLLIRRLMAFVNQQALAENSLSSARRKKEPFILR